MVDLIGRTVCGRGGSSRVLGDYDRPMRQDRAEGAKRLHRLPQSIILANAPGRSHANVSRNQDVHTAAQAHQPAQDGGADQGASRTQGMAEGARDQGDEEYVPHLTPDQRLASPRSAIPRSPSGDLLPNDVVSVRTTCAASSSRAERGDGAISNVEGWVPYRRRAAKLPPSRFS